LPRWATGGNRLFFKICSLGAAVSKRISPHAMRRDPGERGFRRAAIEQQRIRVTACPATRCAVAAAVARVPPGHRQRQAYALFRRAARVIEPRLSIDLYARARRAG
jgi:hypothetical protein